MKAEREVNTQLNKHCQRVSVLSKTLARDLQLPADKIEAAGIAGLHHDDGKYFTLESILTKPGKLTGEEFEQIKEHSADGAFAAAYLGLSTEVVEAIYHHHEDFRGTGYPDKLAGNKIPVLARILRICDVYDALTEERVYRVKILSHEEALRVMDNECLDGKFDPRIYEVFRGNVGRWINRAETFTGIFSSFNMRSRFGGMVLDNRVNEGRRFEVACRIS